MVEIDSDTYQVKWTGGEGKTLSSRFLITPGRSQILDLLQHLLARTHQGIVLCGPDGVGKTALLKVLRKRLDDEWRWCIVNGRAEMSFEDVRERVDPLLRPNRLEAPFKNSGSGHSQDSHKDVVLIIDDAGKMAPGLLTRLIQFAENHPVLHLLFVLTHDEWHIKNHSDPAIENCYIAEVKPLRQKECRDFVQHIVSLTTALRLGNELSDDMIDEVYRESHGIPARIIARFPELNKPREARDPLTILIFAVVCLVSLALYLQWHSALKPADEMATEKAHTHKSQAYFDFSPPILSLPVGDISSYAQNPPVFAGVQQEGPKGVDTADKAVDCAQADSSLSLSKIIVPPSEKNLQTQAAEPKNSLPEADRGAAVSQATSQDPAEQKGAEASAESWLASRPENSFSLQLMILSKGAAVDALHARHTELQPELRVVRRIWKGKEKFVLLYGDFTDLKSAKTAKESLPVEFKSSVIRKFSAIKKEFPSAPKP